MQSIHPMKSTQRNIRQTYIDTPSTDYIIKHSQTYNDKLEVEQRVMERHDKDGGR